MGYLAVDSDAGSEAGVKAEDYGKLRMLIVDAETPVPGPGQVQNTFDADPDVSSFVNILQQGQSQVLNGNLLTLPVGGGLLYVQPVFVQSSGATKLPTLQKVLVGFGDEVAFEDTLQEALDVLFGGDSGASTGDEGVTPTDPIDPEQPVDPEAPVIPVDEYQTALDQARDAMTERQAALQAGDLAAFAEADERLTAAVETLLRLSEQGGTGTTDEGGAGTTDEGTTDTE